MTSTTNPQTHRHHGRRLLGIVSSAAAVAVIGVSALPAETAAAAGVATGHRYGVPTRSAADPATLPVLGATTVVTYRWTERGWVPA